MSDIVAIQSHRCELWIRPKQLTTWNRGAAERRRRGDLPEERIRNRPRERWSERQLFRGKLVQVHVGHSEIPQLGTKISNLRAPVLAKRFLERKIPLLGVTALLISIHAECALTAGCIGIWRGNLHPWPARQHECRIDVVQRLLSDGLNEGKQWRRERRRDPCLFDPGDSIT